MGNRLDSKNILVVAGGKVGRLTILKQIGTTPKGMSIWKCKCSCGTTLEATYNSLMYYKRSCGCLHKENTEARNKEKRDKYIGQTFGYLTVVGFETIPIDGRNIDAICVCSLCNTTCVKPIRSLKAGVKSCGCSTKKLLSLSHGGTGNVGEQPGIKQFIRTCPEGIDWKKKCLEAAEYKCQITGINSNKLEVHHKISQSELLQKYSITIDNYKNYLVELFDVSNGIVLLASLHKQVHKQYGNSPTLEQLEQFVIAQRELIKE